jgi:hypothetical protein
VYRPVEEMLPTAGLTDQFTAVFDVPFTADTNCLDCAGPKATDDGVTETVTLGFKVTVAFATFVGSATLVAMTETVTGLWMTCGATNTPELEMVPAAGVTDHVTAVFVEPETVALNWRDWDGRSVAEIGETATVKFSIARLRLVTDRLDGAGPSPFAAAASCAARIRRPIAVFLEMGTMVGQFVAMHTNRVKFPIDSIVPVQRIDPLTATHVLSRSSEKQLRFYA